MDAQLTRPITMVNEDGELFVSLGQVGKCDADPKVAAAFQKLNESGAAPNWNTFSSLWRERLTARFRDTFMVEYSALPSACAPAASAASSGL
jgi:hypothetical protein